MEQTNIFPHFAKALLNWSEENGCKTFINCSTVNVQGLPKATVDKFPTEIVLNLTESALSYPPQFEQDHIDVTARFNGVACELNIPYSAISVITSPDLGAVIMNEQFFSEIAEKESDEILIEAPKPKSKLRIVE